MLREVGSTTRSSSDSLESGRASQLACCRPTTLAGLANLELVARTAVEGFLTGSASLAALRLQPGVQGVSRVRRRRRSALRRLERVRAHRAHVHPPLRRRDQHAADDPARCQRVDGLRLAVGVSKLQYGKFLAAALAYLAARQHDPVGLIVFDERLRQLPSGDEPRRQPAEHDPRDRRRDRRGRHESDELLPQLRRAPEAPRPRRSDLRSVLRPGRR